MYRDLEGQPAPEPTTTLLGQLVTQLPGRTYVAWTQTNSDDAAPAPAARLALDDYEDFRAMPASSE
jgi:hypothetical protein